MNYPQTNVNPSRRLLDKTRMFFETIKFEHTVFALPFAYLALFLVEAGWPSWRTFLWITLAMVAGRTFGMAANRLIDAEIDARNPRTATRPLPEGRISRVEVMAYMAISAALLVFAVFHLSPWARRLWPVVLIAITAYPYIKRFTWLSHAALGLVYVMVPAGVWIAVTNGLSGAALLLGIGAGFWVAGFDIIYACQDVEVDRAQGLHSMAADFGPKAALRAARVFHASFAVALLFAGITIGVGILYYIGWALTAILLGYEHRLVSPTDISKVNVAFFTTNGVISIVLFVFVAADAIVRGA